MGRHPGRKEVIVRNSTVWRSDNGRIAAERGTCRRAARRFPDRQAPPGFFFHSLVLGLDRRLSKKPRYLPNAIGVKLQLPVPLPARSASDREDVGPQPRQGAQVLQPQ